MRQQEFVTLGHVEIHGRGDLAQIAHRRSNSFLGRPAVIDVERAAVEQHQPDIVVAAESVVPGQPVDDHRRRVGHEGEATSFTHDEIAAQHALRIDDSLSDDRPSPT